MKQITLFIFFTTVLYNSLQAQALNEDASTSYYWANNLAESRLYTDNGLGKKIWLQNQPANWITAYGQERVSLQPESPFGNFLISPTFAPKIGLLTNISSFGEMDASFLGKLEMKKVKTQLRLNGHYFNNPIDRNNDLFVDLPTKQRLYLQNSWEANVPNYTSVNRIQYMGLLERGGSKNSFNDSGHLAVQSQHLIAMRQKDLLLLDFKIKDHSQSQKWGNRTYRGEEWMIDGQARYEYHLENGFDIFRFGGLYRYQRYQEVLDSTTLARTEAMGGGFFGYDTYWGKHLQFTTHLNIIYHNLAGIRLSPLFKINYIATKRLAFNAYTGQGWRYANPLQEQSRYLYSNRTVDIPTPPLSPEEAWYYGASASFHSWVNLGDFPFSQFMGLVNTQFTHSIYRNKVITDIDSDPYAIKIYNQEEGDRAYKLSWELEGQLSWSKPALTFNIDYRLDIQRATIDNSLQDLPFYSRHNWLFNLRYVCYLPIPEIRRTPLFILQNNWYVQSSQRLPDMRNKSNGELYPLQSGRFGRWDLKVTLPVYAWIRKASKWKNVVAHFGFDNLLNEIHSLPFLYASQPNHPAFDAGVNWNTTVSRRFYAGFQYNFR